MRRVSLAAAPVDSSLEILDGVECLDAKLLCATVSNSYGNGEHIAYCLPIESIVMPRVFVGRRAPVETRGGRKLGDSFVEGHEERAPHRHGRCYYTPSTGRCCTPLRSGV